MVGVVSSLKHLCTFALLRRQPSSRATRLQTYRYLGFAWLPCQGERVGLTGISNRPCVQGGFAVYEDSPCVNLTQRGMDRHRSIRRVCILHPRRLRQGLHHVRRPLLHDLCASTTLSMARAHNPSLYLFASTHAQGSAAPPCSCACAGPCPVRRCVCFARLAPRPVAALKGHGWCLSACGAEHGCLSAWPGSMPHASARMHAQGDIVLCTRMPRMETVWSKP